MDTIKSSVQRETIFQGTVHVLGKACGKLIGSDVALSFWGGIDPITSEVIDRHHPLSGQYLQDAILAIPGGRGSCSGSGVMLELLLNGKGPRAVLFARREDILTLGVMIAEEIFARSIPILTLQEDDFRTVLRASYVRIEDTSVICTNSPSTSEFIQQEPMVSQSGTVIGDMQLSATDRTFLDGSHGDAARIAMRIVLRMARLLGTSQLIDIAQVHIDGCVYTGPGSLAFAEKLRDLGGKVLVPTTMNSISVDQKRWREQGVDFAFGSAAEKLGTAYIDMGAESTFTCAPYLLEGAPRHGEQIAWAESNAVVYANSVLGARTMKYPDFLDIAIALTGRAPYGGLHIAANRRASLRITAPDMDTKDIDESFWPLLGYACGQLAGSRIPVMERVERLAPSRDDLKAFGAAFATMASAPMFHMVGVTPEAPTLAAATGNARQIEAVALSMKVLARCWQTLNSTLDEAKVDLISLGNPHFSVTEVRKLANLCRGRTKNADVLVVVTCGRSTYGLASQAGLVEELEQFGVQFITDTCWCMITYQPIIARDTKIIMTNSGKYAHYGPGLTGKRFLFGSLRDCVDAACQGFRSPRSSHFLRSTG